MEDAAIWHLEERLWLEGAEAYRSLVHEDALMAFAGVGILRGAAIAQRLEGAPRWTAVAMEERALARPAPDTIVLAYLAAAGRPGLDRYAAWCTSTWRRLDDAWRMIQHQQTADSPP